MVRLVPVLCTFNEAERLPRAFASLEEGVRTRLVAEWTLADGGSTDRTVDIARELGFRVVTGAAGRGAQLAAGAEAASRAMAPGDAYLFMHADTVLAPGWTRPVEQFLRDAQDRDRAAAFRFALDEDGGAARRLAAMVNWRARALKLPYGDQGLIIPKAFYERLGGYKPWPLFEDVDLVRRIGRARLTLLPASAVTSAERFRREGYVKRSAKNLSLLARYYAGADPAALARRYR